MTEALRKGIPKEYLKVFPCNNQDMVVVSNLEFAGLCPHHLLPIEYKCDIGYIPTQTVLGLSKFHRIAKWCAKQPMLQEELGFEIGKYIQMATLPNGIIVRLKGDHACMRVRGTKSPNSKVLTTTLIGKAFEDINLKSEFYATIEKE